MWTWKVEKGIIGIAHEEGSKLVNTVMVISAVASPLTAALFVKKPHCIGEKVAISKGSVHFTQVQTYNTYFGFKWL